MAKEELASEFSPSSYNDQPSIIVETRRCGARGDVFLHDGFDEPGCDVLGLFFGVPALWMHALLAYFCAVLV